MGHLTTISGKRIDPLNIDPENIDVADIAWALARIVRFNGHQEHAYSVGAHSVCCAMLIDSNEYRLEALLHDASEAYLCDIPTPIKMLLPDYLQMEQRIEAAIREKFELPVLMSAAVKEVDRAMLIAEASVLHPALYAELGSPTVDAAAVKLVTAHMHFGVRNIASHFIEMVSMHSDAIKIESPQFNLGLQ